ncbi:peptide-N-glycosidase [Echinicola sp. CAU 1574]|uniref:Peptide-N-glycosidase n=1 Tax=Echinicola arenosa TaxID=2774144 RepID=A0ABR9AGJ9_9BACT|nr:peptide-N-glycosidase F-related protein [Echinicola arenosa]MBD8487810.1 peptide-N-glycosidase [Echinicola arenosa]
MKHLNLLVIFLLMTSFRTFGANTDTLEIISHDKITVVTDPSKGEKAYTNWAVFPDKDEAIRKIIMKIKFACPDNMRCADWDYVDHITLKRIGGKDGEMMDYEIGRMLTPYGGAFGEDWEFDWAVDVTDFSLLLRDSVEIEYKHTGYEPNNDRGWKVTVAFDMIKGQPAMEPISITKIYQGQYRYGDEENPIEQTLKPITVSKESETSLGRFRVIQTGHGMDRPDGCGEFCNKFRDFLLDGKVMASRQIWKQCGENPLYPQAGTWIFDRANWCPGDLIQPDIYDFEFSQASRTVQLQMENYASPKPSANELISAYVIQYKSYVEKNDVSIEDVIIPSNKAIHSRENPAAFGPTIIVKNNGANTLNSLQIAHGGESQKPIKFQWKGNLKPGATDTIRMDGLIPQEGKLQYHFELSKPNGKRDGYIEDNQMTSSYSLTPVHEPNLIFHLETNHAAEENAYKIIDAKGDIIFDRALSTLTADTTYKDSLHLPSGAYRLLLTDKGGDGLEFWYKTKAGRGKAILLNQEGKILKSFDSDFGSSITYNFTVGENTDPIKEDEISLGVFPTRTNDFTYFDYLSNNPEEVFIRLIKDPSGEVVEEHHYLDFKEGRLTFDLSRYPKSRYYFRVYVKGKVVYNKRVRVKE